MRVAFFLSEFPVLSETFVLNQITGMIDRGHDVDIYAAYRSTFDKLHPQIRDYSLLDKTRYLYDMPRGYIARWFKVAWLVIRKGLWRRPMLVYQIIFSKDSDWQGMNLMFMYAVLAIAGREKYDIIHCQFGTLGPLALKLRRLQITDGVIVTSFRGFDITRVIQNNPSIYNELFQVGALSLAVCEAIKEKLLAAGCPAEKAAVHYSGIDCRRFMFAERSKEQHEPINLLSIGRFVEKKGLAYAIEAVANVHNAGRKVRYFIVGDGELRHELVKKISDCRVEDHVELLGWQEHDSLARIILKAHILIAPSVTAADGDQEGIPNVLKEAMATGLPVLGTEHSGIPELVEDGVTGYLVPERDVDALTRNLLKLCDHPEKWAQMGRQGRKKVEDNFDMEKLNDELEEKYRQLLT